MENLTLGSLFSGIGGFEVGAEKAGIKTLWSCEIESFQRQILKQHFQDTLQYADIRDMQGAGYVDIICGGFPCQDISISGKGVGINGEKSGLWRKMYEICGDVRPKYIVIENSPMLLKRGIETVLSDIAKIGGYVSEWQCISNAAFGYAHRRERLYIIAHTYTEHEQKQFFKHGIFKQVFRSWSPRYADAYASAKRVYDIATSTDVRNTNGFRDWTHRTGSIGNAVNVTVAQYIFECIKLHCVY